MEISEWIYNNIKIKWRVEKYGWSCEIRAGLWASSKIPTRYADVQHSKSNVRFSTPQTDCFASSNALPISNLAKCPDDATNALEPFGEYRVDFCRAKAYTYIGCAGNRTLMRRT
ncbi:3256_t:CDS:2 [Rhizophagus irregularis]|nr:3256_t:CDS:2 [Rhizophagus irregularis]